MIYKFKVWVWLPMTTEIYLSASKDEEAAQTFNKIDLKKGFNWRDDGMRKSRVTYEVTNVQDTNQSINFKREPGKKS
jgi:virulence-associated protein VapD